jgi:GT2 family glycosyltransferase
MSAASRPAAAVDAVVVTYNNSDSIRACVEPLCRLPGVETIVVDNASSDNCLAAIADLPVRTLALERNLGFAAGCNVGWREGNGRFVLFLNPDAHTSEASLTALVSALESPDAAAAGPKIVNDNGALQFSQRRFPRLRSTYAQALFLHRIFPRAPWTDEVMRDERAYRDEHEAEWVSGACVLVKRSALERVGGWDEDFFMYSEDADLCRRLWNAGGRVLFVPRATVVHTGGMSAPRDSLRDELAWSRVIYARKHRGRAGTLLERAGIALGSGLRIAVTGGGRSRRSAHARAFLRVCTGSPARGRQVAPTVPSRIA